jgi:hypothetical protein
MGKDPTIHRKPYTVNAMQTGKMCDISMTDVALFSRLGAVVPVARQDQDRLK